MLEKVTRELLDLTASEVGRGRPSLAMTVANACCSSSCCTCFFWC